MTPVSPSRPRPAAARRRAAFSLVEMVVSLVVAGVLLGTVTSAIVLATNAIPAADGDAAAAVQVAEGFEQFRDDLRASVHLTQRSDTAVTLTLADRTGDGVPEVVTYAWAGSAGDPLTRSVNGRPATHVLSALDSFDLDYDTVDRAQTYAGSPTTSAEIELSSNDPNGGSGDEFVIDNDDRIGLHVTPALPSGATSWNVTRLNLRTAKDGASNGETRFDLTGWTGSEPDGTVIESVTLTESQLSYAFGWAPVQFTTGGPFNPGDAIAISMDGVGSGKDAAIRWASGDTPTSAHTSSDDGTTWSVAGAVHHFLYGTYTTNGDDWTLTRQRVKAVDIELTLSSNPEQTYTARVLVPNVPDAADRLWELDFAGDPTAHDLNGSGSPDWGVEGAANFRTTNLVDSVWTVEDGLATAASFDFDTPVTVQARMRDLTNDGNAMTVELLIDRSGGDAGLILICLKKTGSMQVVEVVSAEGTASNLVSKVTVNDLAVDEFIDVTLVLDPSTDAVAVCVDGADHGTFTYTPVADGRTPGIRLGGEANNAGLQFDHVRVQTGGAVTYTAAASSSSSPLSGGGSTSSTSSTSSSSKWWEWW